MGWEGGCLSIRISRTLLGPLGVSTVSSRCRIPPLFSSDRSRSAALTLTWNIWLANCRDRLALCVAVCLFFDVFKYLSSTYDRGSERSG